MLLLTSAPAVAGGGHRPKTFDVHLLGINDFHGNLTGAGLTYTDPFSGVAAPAGGAGVLATYLGGGEV
jgi:2',3'-cyclic-nucleotide 2'-phosphodiesterase (5'-nucleotidase family)